MANAVVLHVVVVPHMYISPSDYAGYVPIRRPVGAPVAVTDVLLDQMFHAGDVLPAGLSEAAARRFAEIGLTRPVVVRI